MGCECESKKNQINNTDVTRKTNTNVYQNTNTRTNTNLTPIIYTPQSNRNSNNYQQKFINNHNSGSNSHGLSNQNTRAQTKYDKTSIPESEFIKMKKYYYNLLKTMQGGPKTIGEGGQAKIIKEYSPKFKRYVVKKVIKINGSTNDELLRNKISLCKEAILLFTCDYPNVIRIYDFIDNPVTIVMEYCEKGSLRKLLDQDIYLPPIYKIFLIYSICDGLGYIHTKGIVHGDLKCDNILLSYEKKFIIGNKYYPIPKLADFGLSQISPNHMAAGTPGYIAPEIFKGAGLNKKTDIFALGMVMFEILSGLIPVPSDIESAMKFFAMNIPPCTKEVLRLAWAKRDEVLLPGIKNDYYDAFYTIMIRCIDDDPAKRPDIVAIFLVVRKLYKILLSVMKEKVYDESEIEKR